MTAHRFTPPQLPTVARCFIGLTLLFGQRTAAQELRLSEHDAVQRALRRPALMERAAARVDMERGRAATAGTLPNPQFIYMREQTFNNTGTGEDYASIAQTVHLGGRYKLGHSAGEARARARESEARSVELAVSTEVRLRYYEALFRERRVAALEAWRKQVDQALEVVSRREASGDVAPYDKRRLERERTVSEGRLAIEQAHVAQAHGRLAALLALPEQEWSLGGHLLPDAVPAALDKLRTDLVRRPDLIALELEGEAATLAARAADRSKVPELRLEAGYKGVAFNLGGQINRTDGFLAGAALSLPLWDRGRGAQLTAQAEARERRAELALLTGEAEGELAGARMLAEQTRAAALQFRDEATQLSQELMRIAAAGYAGGELGLFELLDSYRGGIDDELTALEMEFAARRAALELGHLTGANLP